MPQNPSDFDGIPAPGPARPEDVIEDLGDGLLLRYARDEDAEANADFQAVVQADPPDFEKLDHIGQWVRQLMDGTHPTGRARDFLLVHDTKKNRIASSLGLLHHEFAYDGIAFPAGQPELVGTHPAYRHRRLIARQFEEIHRWSAEKGERVQCIDGIPWYYRQYGYEMTTQRFGGASFSRGQLPAEMPAGLKVRRAVTADAPFIAETYAHGMQRYRLTCNRDEDFWRFEIDGRVFCTVNRTLRIVENEAGEPLGVFNHVPILLEEGWTWTTFLEVAKGAHWKQPVEAMLAFLKRLGSRYAKDAKEEHAGATLLLGIDHPAYDVVKEIGGRTRRPYAWYLRVPDLPGFLTHVGPALEARLQGTAYEGHTGDLALNFYRTGVRLKFEAGRLQSVEPWRPATDDIGDARFPDLTFLHLLFGHRSLSDLEEMFTDVQPNAQRGLIETLFPTRSSFLMATS